MTALRWKATAAGLEAISAGRAYLIAKAGKGRAWRIRVLEDGEWVTVGVEMTLAAARDRAQEDVDGTGWRIS